MITVLVTGGAGNIGSSIARKLAENPDNLVVVADNLSTGRRENLPVDQPNLKLVKCDVNDFEDVSCLFFAYRFDYVFHYAAVVGVQRTLTHPLMVLDDIKGIENVLKLSKNIGVRRIYYASSSEVYGEPFEIPQNEETTPINSRLPYATVKTIGETYLRTYHREFDLPYIIFRYFNTYGPRQSEDFVVPRFVRRAIAGEDIPVNGDGSQTRTFSYIDDTVEATLRAHYDARYVNETVNIGNDEEMTVLELARRIIKATKSDSEIVHLPPLPEGDMARRRPDNRKMKALLNRPLTSIEEGVSRLVDFYDGQ